MAADENRQVIRQVFNAWNAHDAESYLKLLDKETVWDSDAFPAPFRGHEGARQFFQVYVRAFPDLHLDIEQMIADEDYVVTRWRSSGTHRGDLGGIAPTNRRAELHGCTVTEVTNGKVGRAWVYFDNARLLRQLGVTPEPPGLRQPE
jgi:steroid delta-isomerase-like uncharacterized protein